METPIKLLVDFVSASQGGGGGELVNASTGDIFGFVCLLLLGVVLILSMFLLIRRNAYAKNAFGSRLNINKIDAKHWNGNHANSNIFINSTTKIIVAILAIVAALSIVCISATNNAFAKDSDPLTPDTNKITATVDEDGSITFTECNLTNTSGYLYSIASTSVAVTPDAQSVSAINSSVLSIDGFNGVLYNDVPNGVPFTPTNITPLNDGESTALKFAISNLDKDSAKALCDKSVFEINLTPVKIEVNVPFTGTVKDNNGNPLEGAKVYFVKNDGTVYPETEPHYVVTNNNGVYNFPPVLPGMTGTLHAVTSDDKKEGSVVSFTTPTQEGTTQNITVDTDVVVDIEGTASDKEEAPLPPNTLVRFLTRDSSGIPVVYEGTVSEDGQFEIPNVPGGLSGDIETSYTDDQDNTYTGSIPYTSSRVSKSPSVKANTPVTTTATVTFAISPTTLPAAGEIHVGSPTGEVVVSPIEVSANSTVVQETKIVDSEEYNCITFVGSDPNWYYLVYDEDYDFLSWAYNPALTDYKIIQSTTVTASLKQLTPKAIYTTETSANGNEVNKLNFVYDSKDYPSPATTYNITNGGVYEYGNCPWYEKHTSVNTITFDESFKNYDGLTSLAYWFQDLTEVTSLKVENIDTSKVADMKYIFGCHNWEEPDHPERGFYISKMTSLDISGLSLTSALKNTDKFVQGLENLNTLILPENLDTSKVESADSMFNGNGLPIIDISRFNFDSLNIATEMFCYCKATTIYVNENYGFGNVTDPSIVMFLGANNLKGQQSSNVETWGNTFDRAILDGENGQSGYFSIKPTYMLFDKQDDKPVAKLTYVGETEPYAVYAVNTAGYKSAHDNSATIAEKAPWHKFAGNIVSINFTDDFAQTDFGFTSTSYLFQNCTKVSTLNVKIITTSDSLENVEGMFNCRSYNDGTTGPYPSSTTSIDISYMTLGSGLTNMSNFLCGQGSLTNIVWPENIDVSNVLYMGDLFNGCYVMETIDLSSWSNSKSENVDRMFGWCGSLRKILVNGNNLTFSHLAYAYDMFTEDWKLIGGEGTIFDNSYNIIEYAKVDKIQTSSIPGYFSDPNVSTRTIYHNIDNSNIGYTYTWGPSGYYPVFFDGTTVSISLTTDSGTGNPCVEVTKDGASYGFICYTIYDPLWYGFENFTYTIGGVTKVLEVGEQVNITDDTYIVAHTKEKPKKSISVQIDNPSVGGIWCSDDGYQPTYLADDNITFNVEPTGDGSSLQLNIYRNGDWEVCYGCYFLATGLYMIDKFTYTYEGHTHDLIVSGEPISFSSDVDIVAHTKLIELQEINQPDDYIDLLDNNNETISSDEFAIKE